MNTEASASCVSVINLGIFQNECSTDVCNGLAFNAKVTISTKLHSSETVGVDSIPSSCRGRTGRPPPLLCPQILSQQIPH